MKMSLLISVLTVLMFNIPVLSAQSTVEPITIIQSEQNLIDSQQKNQDVKATCYAAIGGQVFEGESIEDYQLGKWLRGVKVKLKGEGKTKKTRTDSRGKFFFFNLCAGNYTIKCKKRGYYDAKERVTIYNDYGSEGLFIPMSPK